MRIDLLLYSAVLLILASCESEEAKLSNQKTIISFEISGVDAFINESSKTIKATIAEESFIALTPIITISDKASINPGSGIEQDFSDGVIYAVTAEDGSTVEYTVTISSKTHSFNYNDHSYKFVKEKKTWQSAVSSAKREGGYLLEINDSKEQEAIFSEIKNNVGSKIIETRNQFSHAAVWLGGHDLTTEGKWIWDGDNDASGTQFWSGGLDGSPVNNLYNNWGNEPDNSGDQDVLSINLERSPRNNIGEWNDLDGNANRLFFVIEYDQ